MGIAGAGALEGVQWAVCDVKCIDIHNEAIKIFRTHATTQ